MRLTRIHQIAAHVDDLEATRTFYQDTLGARFLAGFDPPGLLFFEFGGVRLMFERSAGPATLYFRVDDVTATFERLVTRGATAREVPEIAHRDPGYDLWLAFVSDLDGNNIGLMREAPKGLERG